jgi:hypothetical protein
LSDWWLSLWAFFFSLSVCFSARLRCCFVVGLVLAVFFSFFSLLAVPECPVIEEVADGLCDAVQVDPAVGGVATKFFECSFITYRVKQFCVVVKIGRRSNFYCPEG